MKTATSWAIRKAHAWWDWRSAIWTVSRSEIQTAFPNALHTRNVSKTIASWRWWNLLCLPPPAATVGFPRPVAELVSTRAKASAAAALAAAPPAAHVAIASRLRPRRYIPPAWPHRCTRVQLYGSILIGRADPSATQPPCIFNDRRAVSL